VINGTCSFDDMIRNKRERIDITSAMLTWIVFVSLPFPAHGQGTNNSPSNGGPWVEDEVSAGVPSDPFLVAGFDQRVLHLSIAKPVEDVKEFPESTNSVVITLQVDEKGNGNWADFQKIQANFDSGTSYIFPRDFSGVWLRMVTDHNCIATAFLHQSTTRFPDGLSAEYQALFAGLADVEDQGILSTLHYPARHNRNLQVIASGEKFPAGEQYFEFTKSRLAFEPVKSDAGLKTLLTVAPDFSIYAASVIIKHGKQALRLPKGHARFSQPFEHGWPRGFREVISERGLANLHGTFYEVTLVVNGQPPAWNLMRPVSSHQKQITDFSTWNGLLVLGGVQADAENDGHVFVDSNSQTGLWFGGIDDLWKLGKPVGDGGPWFETPVAPGVPSDPYLMTGFDRKTVQLSHNSDSVVIIRLEADITGTGSWLPYQALEVSAGETLTHEFPSGYSANWIRAVSDHETSATVQFAYR
jgi:hypothetical protein